MTVDSASLVNRYQFGARYIPDAAAFRAQVEGKTVVPYQIEYQPPPRSTTKICWLECPYCYGGSALDNGDRMERGRGIEIMREIAGGGVKKVIFAGYATDPLNSDYIEELLEIAIDHKMIFGFNTKAIRVSARLLEQLSRSDIQPASYLSVSVDAGSSATYNAMHDVKTTADIYSRVRDNVARMAACRVGSGAHFDISATYLLNSASGHEADVVTFIDEFQAAGCDLLRFTFPQPPRELETEPGVVPTNDECHRLRETFGPLILARTKESCPTLLVDADSEHQIYHKARTLPCFARFIYPTVGFDGWLYHCSQSAAPNFRPMALGNLNERNFWDVFYDYDAANLAEGLKDAGCKMRATGCRCDRKEHVVNTTVIRSGQFADLIEANDVQPA